MPRNLWAALLILCTALGARGEGFDLSADLSAEARAFPSSPAYSSQPRLAFSAAVQPHLNVDWDNRHQLLEISPFFRYDSADSRRTHFDVADLSYVRAWDAFELKIGVRKVFWGVAESQHLVDIVNQSDVVEDFQGEAKLGQPMVNGVIVSPLGNFELYVMPYFRERTYPGVAGHFRGPLVVNTDAAKYESGNGRWNPDVAVRWTAHPESFDIGVSHFYGTNRTPTFITSTTTQGVQELIPYYALIQQTGVDAQFTAGSFLGKLEAITRGDKNYANAYFAGTGGGEYTFHGVVFRSLDVGLLAEYLYDSRGKGAPTTAFEDDIYLGVRLTSNEADGLSFLTGVILDRKTDTQLLLAETSRRFGSDWKVALRGGYFRVNTPHDPLYAFYRDNYFQVEVTRFFLSK